jgi:hypothetical protein
VRKAKYERAYSTTIQASAMANRRKGLQRQKKLPCFVLGKKLSQATWRLANSIPLLTQACVDNVASLQDNPSVKKQKGNSANESSI